MNITCPNCNTEKYFKPSRVRKGARFCSMKCYGENKKGVSHTCSEETRKKIGEANCIALKGRKLSKEHKENIGRAASLFLTGKVRSYESRVKQSMTIRGITDIGEWSGFTGTERHQLMGKLEYRLWREAVFVRDNWTCQECNIRGGKLEADHIKPWALFSELRYVIDNGRTLCVSCHRQTDTWGRSSMYRKVGA